LLDRELVERAASFGAKECIDLERGLGKLPLRSALGRRVDFSTQKKRGFTVSMDDWIRGPLRDAMSESLGSLRGLESVDVDRKALHGLFERHLTGEENNGMALFRLLMLDRWLAKVASARAAA
ncbi:MAG: asparagine synthase-related protein, partial [Acidobacteriota bacterium]